jgi:hypothetical protein
MSVTAAAAAPHAVLVTKLRKMFVSIPARVMTALRLLRTAGRTAEALLLLALPLLKQLRLVVCCINMVAGDIPAGYDSRQNGETSGVEIASVSWLSRPPRHLGSGS